MDTYVLRVEDAPAGSAGASITLEQWPESGGTVKIADGLSAMSLGRYSANDIRGKMEPGQPDDPDLPEVGRLLYEMLVPGNVKTALENLIDSSADARFVLDVRSIIWRDLPWELARQGNRLLFARPNQPWSRGELNANLPAPRIEWPLRILIVIGSRPGDPDVKAEEEVRQIMRALEPVDVQVDVLVERQPGLAQLQALLQVNGRQPHIFHYIGHGGVQEAVPGVSPGKTWLQIYNSALGQDEDWTAEDIFQAFDTGHKPNLVILNACKSASAGAGGNDNFSQQELHSLSNSLIEAGVRAVLGMGAKVEAEVAIRCSVAFYKALAGGGTIDFAAASARNAIAGVSQPSAQRTEWAAPILQVRGAAGNLFRLPAAPRPPIPTTREFDELRRVVDRRPDRHDAWQKMHGPKSRVFALVGDMSIGKTWLAKVMMARCCLAGWRVGYIDLSENSTIGPIDLLLRITDGDGSGTPLTSPLEPRDPGDPQSLFYPFRQQLAADRAAAENPQGIDTEKLNAYERIFARFIEGLAQYAAAQPLVIVIDYKALARENNNKWNFDNVLVPKLFNRIAERQENTIALVLTVRSEDYKWLLERGLRSVEECAVRGFPASEYEDLAWEWVSRNMPPPADPDDAERKMGDSIAFLKGLIGKFWTPDDFDGLRYLAAKAGYRR